MNRSQILLASLLLAAAATAQNPYVRSGAGIAVIADPRARNVGDILTIVVQEQHSVRNEEKVERRQDTSLAARLDAYSLSDKTFQSNVLPRIDVRKEQDFQGEAKQNQGSDVRASIAVVVVDVQPNGNRSSPARAASPSTTRPARCASAVSCGSSTSRRATRSAARWSPMPASRSPARVPTPAR